MKESKRKSKSKMNHMKAPYLLSMVFYDDIQANKIVSIEASDLGIGIYYIQMANDRHKAINQQR